MCIEKKWPLECPLKGKGSDTWELPKELDWTILNTKQKLHDLTSNEKTGWSFVRSWWIPFDVRKSKDKK